MNYIYFPILFAMSGLCWLMIARCIQDRRDARKPKLDFRRIWEAQSLNSDLR